MRSVRRYLDKNIMIDLYYTFFYTHLIYGIEFWGHAGKDELNKILVLQKKALRIILKIKPNSPVSTNFKNLKIMPVTMLFKYRILILFLKTFSTEDIHNMLTTHTYNTRLKTNDKLVPSKFKSNKGQRSILFTAIHLYNEHLSDLENLSLGLVKEKLTGRLWATCGLS